MNNRLSPIGGVCNSFLACGQRYCKFSGRGQQSGSMETQAPPKPARGSWHQAARELRAMGLSYHEIGLRLGVSGPAVYFCLNPGRRWKGKKKTEAEAPVPSTPSA
jgi:DNA invertase Pin-like site-specific DNA recombinase